MRIIVYLTILQLNKKLSLGDFFQIIREKQVACNLLIQYYKVTFFTHSVLLPNSYGWSFIRAMIRSCLKTYTIKTIKKWN
jgi:hypothetical protein